MKLKIFITLPLCLSLWLSSAQTAAATEKATSVITTFYTEFCRLVSGGGDSAAEAALLSGFLTPELIAEVHRVREVNLYDPIIRAQDFDPNSLQTLTVTHVHGDWYAVSYYAPYNRKCVVIPVRTTESEGTIRISGIAIQ